MKRKEIKYISDKYFKDSKNKKSICMNIERTCQKNIFNYVINKLKIERHGLKFNVAFNIFMKNFDLKIPTGMNRKLWLIEFYLTQKNDILNGYQETCSTIQWKILRKKVFEHYGYACMKCGYNNKSNHIDHIKPKSKYPELAYEFNNLQVLCKDCNFEKSSRSMIDYRYIAQNSNNSPKSN